MFRKKAFTFAELMISLVVISVIAAVVYPTIAHYTPNSNKPLFKSAYRTLSDALGEITTQSLDGELATALDAGVDLGDPAVDNTGRKLCSAFCNMVNVIPECDADGNNCNASCDASHVCSDNILTTSNGMRWHFANYANDLDLEVEPALDAASSYFLIEVDVNATNNNITSGNNCGADGTLAATAGRGLFCYTADANPSGIYSSIAPRTYNLQRLKLQDTFQFVINNKGKIVALSPAGWANLRDAATD